MSNGADDSTRPAKRARLDDSTAPSLSVESTAQAPQAAPKAPAPTVIDNDLEREVRAGITEYICPNNLGFTGVLKQRYTDFLVNEIGLDGQVLHLRSTEVESKESRRHNGKGVNGGETKKEVSKDVKIEVREEKNDAEMADVQNGSAAAQTTTIKVETAPEKSDTADKDAGGQKEEVKEEPEEELPEEDRETLHSIFGEDTTKHILTLVRQVRRREHKKAKDFKAVTSPPITDKDTRTQAHQCLRRIFPNLLESAMEEDQSIRIKATPPAERKGKKKGKGGNQDRSDAGFGRNRGQLAWEELGGEYLHFNLYKENKDTMEVVGFLGSKLNCGTKGFGFAGTKDRRACTVQRLCVKKQTAERIHGFNKVLYNAAVGDFAYRNSDLKLGDLKGNEFTITLRDCHFQNEEGLDFEQRHKLANQVIEKAITDFSEKGFINYYGLQRFGSFAASTDAIGRKMLQDDLQGAVEDLLAYNDVALAAAEGTHSDSNVLVSQDDRNRAMALHIWKTEGSGSAALDMLPRKFTAERNIIQHLSSRNSKTGRHDRRTDWQGALMTIPRNLRLMYVHAYQSLVWNVVAGKRWITHGDNVVEGDLVLVNDHRDKEISNQPVRTEAEDQDGEFIINPSGSENANAAEADFERARPLTASEAASGKYAICDVVLPQPGYDVEYPKNAIGEFYKEFMGSEKGGGLDPYNMRRPWREISLSGGYRKFLARPLEPLDFQVHRYTKEDEQFVETDLQRLRKGSQLKSEEAKDVEMEEGEEQEAKKLAVVIKLQLGSSQYATMALRELMKAGGVKAFKPEYMGGR
ncbi:pseudouridine synthase-like protein TruD/Pus7 [Cucurbitaria berberidis CBS 394.84]|uniref:Pseudouridine synthase-like protein TruD/Pus7 n=1 Tax=Cucurbitaria berberidis CBS 394.84 TaxID=1168544 RepID=A0A9P4L7E7_9PLEO|nr:pseudouridine synthase-like protein TruD/Pus7 [Cucurbitaria berberidis CBS 394.84]KAF1844234.1 pseudouridine synthase-like protein TruD/Pus7 [Cucurbitaria berberidis CBS 394.84]